jgi:hypothetical protein
MEIKKVVLWLLLIPLFAIGQEVKEEKKYPRRVIDNGMLSGGLTFAAGFANSKTQNIYVQGYMEYMFQKNISVRGDIFVFINSLGENSRLNMNHQLLVFSAYHIPNNSPIDPYFGLGPGIAMTRLEGGGGLDSTSGNLVNKISANTFITFNCGFRYYAPKWFHMYIEAGYVLGRHVSSATVFDISELRVSFGLGFNINVLTQRKTKKSKK